MDKTKQLTTTAILIAIGILLPMAFHMVPQGGRIFLPMHIPVLISGFIVGPVYGLLCGVLTPILSSVLTSMPPAMVLPGMVVELGVYGLCGGLLMKSIKIENETKKIYVVLIVSMLVGRLASGIVNGFIIQTGKYSMQMWITASFVTALPGIVVQLLLIPVLVKSIRKSFNK